MAAPRELRMGIEGPSPSVYKEESRAATPQATIEHFLPKFVQNGEDGGGGAHGGILRSRH